jgi:2'-5' RNA ligase
MPRLFTGLELPHHVREQLHRLKAPLPGAKWVDADSLHVTLRFAGDIGNLIAREFAAALEQIDVPVFSLRISGLGAFGGNDPHVIYAGIEPSDSLDALARANERAARNAGLPAEGRAFKGHITLARLRHSSPEAVARYLGRHGAFRSEPFTIERFVLFSSKPLVGGGPYVAEQTFPLEGSYAGFEWEDSHRPE